MLIGNRSFPYPLLKNGVNNIDYKVTQFYFDFDKNEDVPIILNEMLVLKNIYFYLDNSDLKKLYDAGAVKVICEIECSSTVYREYFELFEYPQDKEIPVSNFANDVTISAYMVAAKKIHNYWSNDFADEYTGYRFNINPSNILASDDGIKFRVDIAEENDSRVSSIFKIIKKDDAGEIVAYSNEYDRIVIYLNPEIYSIYEEMKKYSTYNNFFFANLAIPVLASCLQELQKELDYESIDEICDNKKWFESVIKSYALRKGKELDIEEFYNINCFELAQLLLNESVGKSIKDFYEYVIKTKQDEEEDDYE